MDNEELAELDPLTRLLFIYLWMLADREGRLEDRPKRIAAQALAYDRAADADAMLNDLASYGFIKRYQVDGKKFIQIANFTKHQTPHGTERDSSIPDENGEITVYERTDKGYVTKAKQLTNESLTVKQQLSNETLTVKQQLSNETLTVKQQLSNETLTVKQQNDNALIPDSLIPDSPIPDSLIPDSPIPDSRPSGALPYGTSDSGEFSVPSGSVAVAKRNMPPDKKLAEKSKKSVPVTGETWDAYSDAYRKRYGTNPVRNATVSGQLAQFVKRIGIGESPHVARFFVFHNNNFYVQKMHTVGLLLADAEKLRTEWATGRVMTSVEARQTDSRQNNFNVFNQLIEEKERRKNERNKQENH